jgi:hypothetical protein
MPILSDANVIWRKKFVVFAGLISSFKTIAILGAITAVTTKDIYIQ